jgi:hypothetical protein
MAEHDAATVGAEVAGEVVVGIHWTFIPGVEVRASVGLFTTLLNDLFFFETRLFFLTV